MTNKPRPLFAKDSEQEYFMNNQKDFFSTTTSRKPLYGVLRLLLVGLAIAITAVCFMAPVIDRFGEWLDESFYHAIIVQGITVLVIGSVLMYLKFKQ